MLLTILVSITVANAYQFMTNDSGGDLHWASMPIQYYINPDNSVGLSTEELEDLMHKATQAWIDTGADVKFEYLGTTTMRETAYDNYNVVYFMQEWNKEEKLLALTSNWSTASGSMVAFDIAINETDWDWGTDGDPELMDLENTMTHEFGHVLGLGHSVTDELATMWASTSRGETQKRDLRPDDIEGVRAIYGISGELGLGCSNTGLAGTSYFLIGIAGLFVYRRRVKLS